jgi:hypothetical protein
VEAGGKITRTPTRMQNTWEAIVSSISANDRSSLHSMHVSSKKKLDDLATTKRSKIRTEGALTDLRI